MTQLKPLNLLVVELPEGVKNVSKGGLYLPVDKDWIFHFTTQTATEQDWAGVVGVSENEFYSGWTDYTGEISAFHSATESGHSLLAANGLPIERNYAILTIKQ
jgi:hypothetical protein